VQKRVTIVVWVLAAVLCFSAWHTPLRVSFQQGVTYALVDTSGENRVTLLVRPAGKVFWKMTTSEATRHHRFTVELTEPATLVEYMLLSSEFIEEGTFRLLPQQTPFTVGVYGDSRNDHNMHRRIVEGILRHDPAFVINTGDIVNSGDREKEWLQFFADITPLSDRPYFVVVGNHEYPLELFSAFFHVSEEQTVQYFDTGSVRWIQLNSYLDLSTGSPSWNFLEERLRSAKEEGKMAIVLLHHPVLSAGPHHSDSIVKELQGSLLPLFETYDVPLVISGHDHAYQHLVRGNTHFIVTGGGGAALYPKAANPEGLVVYEKENHYVVLDFEAERIQARAFDTEGNILDFFSIPLR